MKRNILTVPIQRLEGSQRTAVQDLLAVEDPLEIRLNNHPVSITMRTPGHDTELAVGFLFTEGILTSAAPIESIRQKPNSLDITLLPGHEPDLTSLQRNFYMTSSCGVCGKATIESLQASGCPVLPRNTLSFDAAVIHALPDRLRQSQPVFDRTGGLHAAALFTPAGELTSLREDVGRHNAVDKLIGVEVLASRTPAHDKLMLVSGRASFELVQKALMAGIPILAAVGAPSSLAVQTAQRYGLTLLGFVRQNKFNVYSGGWRIHEIANVQ